MIDIKNYKKKFNNNGFVFYNLKDLQELNRAQRIITVSKHQTITDKKKFYKKNIQLQNKIYKLGIHKNILNSEFDFFKKILGVSSKKDLMITSFLHLRAVKKNKRNKKSYVGFHRETFYSDFDYTRHQVNISIPLLNYSFKNSIKFIRGSHKIPDNRIKTIKLNSNQSKIHKNSDEHKLGFAYNPKIIIKGVKLKNGKRAKAKVGQIIVFKATTIHGDGKNNSHKIRYSLDFGLIKKKYLVGKKLKDHHISYTKDKKYWTSLG